MVKTGWWVYQRDLNNCSLHWPYVAPCYPLPKCLFFEKIDICYCTWDTYHKFCDHFHRDGHLVFELPELWHLPLPQQIKGWEEQCFWLGQDIESREVLE